MKAVLGALERLGTVLVGEESVAAS
jgi:hypothetical protein